MAPHRRPQLGRLEPGCPCSVCVCDFEQTIGFSLVGVRALGRRHVTSGSWQAKLTWLDWGLVAPVPKLNSLVCSVS